LHALARQMALYPTGHPTTGEALTAATGSAEGLASGGGGEVVLTLLTDSFYLDRTLLAHASLESSALLRTMQGRGIESISFLSPVAGADIADLGAFVAGLSGDVPAESTVRLNESPYSKSDLESDSESARLRRSYTRSLDVLRGVAGAIDTDEPIDLSVAAWAVEQLVEQTISQPAASLLLSTMKSHDEYTFFHSVNVCILSIALGRLSGLAGDQLKVLAIGALLHDIGKIRVDSSILQFPVGSTMISGTRSNSTRRKVLRRSWRRPLPARRLPQRLPLSTMLVSTGVGIPPLRVASTTCISSAGSWPLPTRTTPSPPAGLIGAPRHPTRLWGCS